MEINLKTGEFISLDEVNQNNKQAFMLPKEETLCVIWGVENDNSIFIDNIEYEFNSNQLFFLTEFHQINIENSKSFRAIKFNRTFYCIANHDTEIGCKGLLYFGNSKLPTITLENENIDKFELLWKVFQSEKETKDNLQLEMLQMLLKRFLILSTRIYKEQNEVFNYQTTKEDLIREFYFLVENNFKTTHSVSEYANLLNKSAKSLTNYFSKNYTKNPLQIIQERILIEAKRLLLNSNLSVKEISFELGFEDIQSFSRFFKNKEKLAPTAYKKTQLPNN
jgi:AraC family transcriptional regulator, transcriptional activator of pobA